MPCSYCGVPGHSRDECATRQEREIGTDRQLDAPLETCPECGTTNNRSVNSSCWKCGYDFTEDREIRCDGGTVRPEWTPVTDEKTAPTCRNCGSQVTRQFARVFGDNQDVPHACPECAPNRTLARDASNAGGGLR